MNDINHIAPLILNNDQAKFLIKLQHSHKELLFFP